jgi:hypothetical protein
MKKTYEEKLRERDEAIENLRIAWANFKQALKDCFNDVYKALNNATNNTQHK